ncbi:hypothetical protein [Thiomonas sp. X19]|uniref:hypothetical protein n=1 Tax=Thiomonas sp. X19 TaxID=1050370 RepID=UPI001E2A22EF|nr:hypothetical protein [Thiomonas sp. X19]
MDSPLRVHGVAGQRAAAAPTVVHADGDANQRAEHDDRPLASRFMLARVDAAT